MDDLLERLNAKLARSGLSRYAVDKITADSWWCTEMAFIGPDQEDYDQTRIGGAALVLCTGETIDIADLCQSDPQEERISILCGLPAHGPEQRLAAKLERYYANSTLDRGKIRAALEATGDDDAEDASDAAVEAKFIQVADAVEELKALILLAETEKKARLAWEEDAFARLPVKRMRDLERRVDELQKYGIHWAKVQALVLGEKTLNY